MNTQWFVLLDSIADERAGGNALMACIHQRDRQNSTIALVFGVGQSVIRVLLWQRSKAIRRGGKKWLRFYWFDIDQF